TVQPDGAVPRPVARQPPHTLVLSEAAESLITAWTPTSRRRACRKLDGTEHRSRGFDNRPLGFRRFPIDPGRWISVMVYTIRPGIQTQIFNQINGGELCHRRRTRNSRKLLSPSTGRRRI